MEVPMERSSGILLASGGMRLTLMVSEGSIDLGLILTLLISPPFLPLYAIIYLGRKISQDAFFALSFSLFHPYSIL